MNKEKILLEIISAEIDNIKNKKKLSSFTYRKANTLFINGQCQMLTQSKDIFEFSVDDEFDDFKVKIIVNEEFEYNCNCKNGDLCHHKFASLLQLKEEISHLEDKTISESGKAYTRKGMIKRVMTERKEKALKAEHQITFADNKFGEHVLTNERGIEYKLTFRNINEEKGYCSCPDYQTNKLGTCKHLMYAFSHYKKTKNNTNLQHEEFPFVDVFLDPNFDYKITWYFPHKLPENIQNLMQKYFKGQKQVEEKDVTQMLGFMQEAEEIKKIKIRPEVIDKIERAYNKKLLSQLEKTTNIEQLLSENIKNITLFPYQKKGVSFATFKDAAIIADEMGLGKTIQAITTSILKKTLFNLKKTLVICPASLKEQWKNEIEKYTNEKATVIGGNASQRKEQYETNNTFFLITNYEAVLRDTAYINDVEIDFMILDEAQRIKNYSTQTYGAIQKINKKQSLVITGTPIENKLIDLYSIVNIIDDKFLTPLWEFSYQYCYFDQKAKNKITGYYNLKELKTRLKEILIRREKKDVLNDLPNVRTIDIPIDLHPNQQDYHASFSHTIARILSKKFITAFDMQRIMNTLTKMRMVCDSTYLIDLETNFSPKLDELEYILTEKMDLQNQERKIIIFSEWKKMNLIIGKTLHNNKIGFVELNGSVPVKKRGALIKEFEENPKCKVFISTEAGSVGLNLQIADTVINFELPWNPAKKNQRIGRIDRIGQKNQKLTVLNFITRNSIESKIAKGLVLKQNLFESVLSQNYEEEMIDFSSQGRSQFLQNIEEMINSEPEKTESKEHDEINEIENIVPKETKELEMVKSLTKEQPPKPPKKDISIEKQTEQQQFHQTAEQMEQVMQQGLGFISGLFKMATGNDLITENKGIELNKETGEVTLKFKLPIK